MIAKPFRQETGAIQHLVKFCCSVKGDNFREFALKRKQTKIKVAQKPMTQAI